MGFPSPAQDYTERRLTPETICQIDNNSLVVETSSGYAVINRALRCQQRSTVLIQFHGHSQFAKLLGQAFITDDGDAIEGEALDEVNVIGVVTFFINRTKEDACPVM